MLKEKVNVKVSLERIHPKGKRSKYTKDQIRDVLESVNAIGMNKTSKKYNISKSTIRNWRNPGKNSKNCKKYYKANKDILKENSKKYYNENKDACINRQIEYNKQHPEVYKKWYLNNKRKNKNIGGSLGIINCAAQKKDFRCKASEMYDDSKLFRTMRDYCMRNYDEYIILSAYYGVLYPDDIIEPYKDTVMFVPNQLLHSGKEYHALNVAEKREWSKKVVNSINWDKYSEINFHCGGYYMEFLKPLVENKENVIIHEMISGITNNIKNYSE